jgi:carbon storage regulator
MLVLTRKVGEELVIDDDIHVVVLSVKGEQVRLGISAPPTVRVDRQEVHANRVASAEELDRLRLFFTRIGPPLCRAELTWTG